MLWTKKEQHRQRRVGSIGEGVTILNRVVRDGDI